MSWQVLRFSLPADRVDEALQALAALGSLGAEERPAGGAAWPIRQPWEQGALPSPAPARVELLAYFERDPEAPHRARRLAQALPFLPADAFVEGRLDPGDWEERWRSGFRPIEFAPGLWLAPPWEAPPGALLIEPGTAFGTGQHPTTLACLRAVARHARRGQTMLDVGCGTGLLALLAARLGMIAEGTDNDPAAVRAAWENARRNDLGCRFDTRPLHAIPGRYDLVIANIYAEALLVLAADLGRLTGGRLVLAGILADRLPRIERAFSPLVPARRSWSDDWVTLELIRP
ncbi:MAG: 50S ribosomal protein L11 methyltransferase [Pseudomonadota bacterium]